MPYRSLIILFVFILLSQEGRAQDQSVLSEGLWLKMGIVEEGVYKLTKSDLDGMAMNPTSIDPRNIKVFGKGGMLEQELDISTNLDPHEIAIYIEGEDDGIFNQEDYILFYAKGPHSLLPNSASGRLKFQKNYYSDTVYYYLNYSDNAGTRVSPLADVGGSNPVVTTYDHLEYEEEDLYNILGSGREWLGAKFNATSVSRNISWDVEGVAANSEIIITPRMMAYSFSPTQFSFRLNNIQLGSLAIPSVSDYIFDEQGKLAETELLVSSALFNNSEFSLNMEFLPSLSSSEGYQDLITIQFERNLDLLDEQLVFSSFKSIQQPISEFQLISNSTNISVWNITDPATIQNQEITNGSNIWKWNAASTEISRYVAFEPSKNLLKPIVTEKLNNQNIKGNSTPDLIIVTYPAFLSEAQRLANFRSANDGLEVLVLSAEEVFNEFSYGIADPTAIRNMAYHFYSQTNDPGKLKYLLFFGRGSYDYKNIRRGGLNFVPVYQSRESLDPLKTFSSDDYFGFLELGEGEWEENSSGNHSMDISVGRLPVKTISEAQTVVDKLIHYDSSSETLGEWRRNLVFVADDGDFNIHQSQSNRLVEYVDTTILRYNMKKVYLDNYKQIPRAGGEKSPDMTEAITRSIEEGALIVNYTGHGGESGWAQEFVLDQFIVDEWKNSNKLPLLVTATCEFGRHDNPTQISTGELTLLNPNGGSIGLVSTSRPVFSSTNFQLNRAFYETVFNEGISGSISLGEVFRITKNNSLSGVNNRNFSLLGDPSMTLAYPHYKIRVDQVNEKAIDISDTLGALGMVNLEGSIYDVNDQVVSDFNGEVDIILFDKQKTLRTLGDESPPFNYKDWNNRLFRGKASVVNGVFSTQFLLPKNTIYSIGEGKISMYATDSQQKIDASGTELDIKIGGEEEPVFQDNTPPSIEVFINDTSFTNGTKVPSDTRLIVNLNDESGINISGHGVGQQLEAVLDEETVFNLNNYYSSSLDDFTSGWVEFDLFNLSEGRHTIKVTAWDNQNNFSESSIDFVVSDNPDVVINAVRGNPNPFTLQSVISIEHNRPNDDLEVSLEIFDRMGKLIWVQDYLIENSPIRIKLDPWFGENAHGEKVEQGIYIVKVILRSLSDGSKNVATTKLINLK